MVEGRVKGREISMLIQNTSKSINLNECIVLAIYVRVHNPILYVTTFYLSQLLFFSFTKTFMVVLKCLFAKCLQTL